MSDAEKWNLRHANRPIGEGSACQALRCNLHLLPAAGEALELACGRGGNAISLARAGLRTSAWDCSDVVIAALAEYATDQGLDIQASCRDVVSHPPAPESFDVIVVSHFLAREIIPMLRQALRPGGLIFYQTFVRECVSPRGPRRAAYRLEANELLRWFCDWRVLLYREEGRTGDLDRGLRDEAMLVARRP